MCSNYTLKQRTSKLLAGLRDLPKGFKDEEVDIHPFPYKPGLVAAEGKDGPELREMSYSLVPAWSPEPRVKFTSYNTRIDTVVDKPTWKEPFRKYHIIVPMTEFTESSYWGKPAGNIISFFQKDKELLYAAGIYSPWINQKTGEVIETYSILTDDPPKSIDDNGHDRCPLFLNNDAAREWLVNADTSEKSDAKKNLAYNKDLVDFLRDNRAELKFEYDIVRPLKSGWEKYTPANRKIR